MVYEHPNMFSLTIEKNLNDTTRYQLYPEEILFCFISIGFPFQATHFNHSHLITLILEQIFILVVAWI